MQNRGVVGESPQPRSRDIDDAPHRVLCYYHHTVTSGIRITTAGTLDVPIIEKNASAGSSYFNG